MASSPRGNAQPPCANPSRVSSSGWPGPCITPSSVTWLITTTLPICPSFALGSATICDWGLLLDRHDHRPLTPYANEPVHMTVGLRHDSHSRPTHGFGTPGGTGAVSL